VASSEYHTTSRKLIPEMTCVAIRASPWLFEAMRVGDEEPGVRRDQALVRRFAMRGCHCCSRPVTALPVAEVNDPFPATFDGRGRDDLQCPLHVETSQADGILP
jgi:hypothetical protein